MTDIKYRESVDKCINWMKDQMLTYDNGYNGVYERIRIDKKMRSNWVRPDCNTEIARVLALYKKLTGETVYDELYDKIVNWLLRVQDSDPISVWYGTFPFFVTDGTRDAFNEDLNISGKAIWQNDNGKILTALVQLYRLTNDNRLLDSALRLADFWLGVQKLEGFFVRNDGRMSLTQRGPDFILWLAAGISMCYTETGDKRYDTAAAKAYDYALSLQMDSGRMQTSYELDHCEDFRPTSSETAIAIYSFSIGYGERKDVRLLNAAEKAAAWLLSLQGECGGIRNCDDACMESSLQRNKSICDLVYTQGYALMGLGELWRQSGSDKYFAVASQLADFLTKIQCKGESWLWDGAWRGSFDIDNWEWSGRCDQNNSIDEGGMYSVYTGWCCAPIMFGMMTLLHSCI